MKLKSQKDFFDQITDRYEEYNKSKHSIRNLKIIKSLKPKKKILSLGCGGGREVKELVQNGKQKVVAVDISKKMIEESKKIEPKAQYYIMDAVKFVEKYKGKKKFDYILGLFTFLNYIERKDMKKLIDNLIGMLNKDGKIIFEIRGITERWQEFVKVLIAPFYAVCFNKNWKFGDVYSKNPFNKKEVMLAHLLTKKQLRNLLKDYNYKIYDKRHIVCIEGGK